MSTFEAYVNLGTVSIAVSAVGAPIRVESKRAAVETPTAILTVLLPLLFEVGTDETVIENPVSPTPSEEATGECMNFEEVSDD